MTTLNIAVPESRERAAVATLQRGLTRHAQGYAAASTSMRIAAARGNPDGDPLRAWGHPPTGTYRLINSRPSGADCAGEYGEHFLLFEPQSGAALTAQAAGRVGLLVYGGPAGPDKLMRRTQGGVRLDNKMLKSVIEHAAHKEGLTLTIETFRKPSWWQFWKRPPDTPALSSSAAKAYPAPLDEMSLVLELMKDLLRRPLRHEDRRDRDDSRSDDRSGSSSNSASDTFRGGGGQSGGAGASGSWDSAASTTRGVDASGRIMAGAGLGIAAAIAASAAAGASARDADNTAAPASAESGDTGSFSDVGNTTASTTSY